MLDYYRTELYYLEFHTASGPESAYRVYTDLMEDSIFFWSVPICQHNCLSF